MMQQKVNRPLFRYGCCIAGMLAMLGCDTDLPLEKTGVRVGVLAHIGDEQVDAVQVAVDVANISNTLSQGQLHLETAFIEDYGSIESAFDSLAKDSGIPIAVALVEGEEAVEVAGLAQDRRLFTVMPHGTAWWATAQAGPDQWHLGMIASTAGAVAALTQLSTKGSFVCSSLGVVLNGSDALRQEDITLFEALATFNNIPWSGVAYVPVDGAQEALWPTPPNCIVVERGAHAFGAELAGRYASMPEVQFIFENAQGVEEFVDEPELVLNLPGQHVMNTTNGPVRPDDHRQFVVLYESSVSEQRTPGWLDERTFDSAIIVVTTALVTVDRELAQSVFRSISTSGDFGDRRDGMFSAVMLPQEVFAAVRITGQDLSAEGFTGPGADYTGASGSIEYPEQRPVPLQSYSLRRIVNYVEDNFESVARVRITNEGDEYELAVEP